MIPKIIHYVWVGRNPKPKNIKKCMKSWEKNLQDFKVIEWNEDNFDMHQNKFLEEAYKAKKWAFVSDYIRAYVIYKYGGIYLDSDVIVLDDLKELLDNKCFVGFETNDAPFTAVFGAEPHHPFIKKMLDYYKDKHFSLGKKGQNITNTRSVSDILIEEYNCQTNNKEQVLKDGIHVYPSDILCTPSRKSKTIHVFLGSWLTNKRSFKSKLMLNLRLNIHNKYEAQIYHEILRVINKGRIIY